MNPEPKPIRVVYLDGPRYPLETLWYVWQQSRCNDPLPSPQDLYWIVQFGESFNNIGDKYHCSKKLGYKGGYPADDPEGWKKWVASFRADFHKTVEMLFSEDIPVTENLTFVFGIENVPVSWREQAVRHRIGNKFDGRLGADIVPDQHHSSWWSQTMRVIDMGKFYDEGQWFKPNSIDNTPIEDPHGTDFDREEVYRCTLLNCQAAYQALVKSGVPAEDARQVLPMAVTHRLTWELNLKALMHIIGKRTCWISQYGMWEQVVRGMVEGLAENVHPIFRTLLNPPCIKGRDTWKGCPYDLINRERITGADGFPPCPLWLSHYEPEALQVSRSVEKATWVQIDEAEEDPHVGPNCNHGLSYPGGWVSLSQRQAAQMDEGRQIFRDLWKRDVDTGQPLA